MSPRETPEHDELDHVVIESDNEVVEDMSNAAAIELLLSHYPELMAFFKVLYQAISDGEWQAGDLINDILRNPEAVEFFEACYQAIDGEWGAEDRINEILREYNCDADLIIRLLKDNDAQEDNGFNAPQDPDATNAADQ